MKLETLNSIRTPAVRRRILGELTVVRHIVTGLSQMGFTYGEYYDSESGETYTTDTWDGHNGMLDVLCGMDEEFIMLSKPGPGHGVVTIYLVYGNEPCEVVSDYGFGSVTVEEREAIDAMIQDICDRVECGELPHMTWAELAKPIHQPVERIPEQYWFVDVQATVTKTFCVKASSSHEAWQEGLDELKAWAEDGYPIDGWSVVEDSGGVNDVEIQYVSREGIAP
jgi:hypothetical protein